MKKVLCQHLEGFTVIHKAKKYECDECIKVGDQWVHLRTCQSCGATLCCDSSPNQHMTKHFHAEGHPIMISVEPNENWAWCYIDSKITKY